MCEIIERMNVLACPKPKNFLFLPTMVVNEVCNHEFFRAGKFSWDNASSINISATTNEQKASQQKKKKEKKKKGTVQ